MTVEEQIENIEREINQLKFDLKNIQYAVTRNMIKTVVYNKEDHLAELKNRIR